MAVSQRNTARSIMMKTRVGVPVLVPAEVSVSSADGAHDTKGDIQAGRTTGTVTLLTPAEVNTVLVNYERL